MASEREESRRNLQGRKRQRDRLRRLLRDPEVKARAWEAIAAIRANRAQAAADRERSYPPYRRR